MFFSDHIRVWGDCCVHVPASRARLPCKRPMVVLVIYFLPAIEQNLRALKGLAHPGLELEWM